MFKSCFLDRAQADALVAEHGTPLFVYSRTYLKSQAQTMLGLDNAYELTVRYAMKANPYPGILDIFRKQGVKIDASSGYEAAEAIEYGFAPGDILLTSQQLAHNLEELVTQGVQFNATSLRQLEAYGQAFAASNVAVRLNPGIGSGHSSKTNVGGVTSSFGIWHERIPQIHELARKYNLRITRLHTHIGAGTDPDIWLQAARTTLSLVEEFPDVTILNLGGGFKVARKDDEQEIDISAVGRLLKTELQAFQVKTGRELHLELEPGTFMVANAGLLISRIDDIVDTGSSGYHFIKLDTGMNDILRPGMYGSQHPIAVLNNATETDEYIVVGHNCESGDLLTPTPGDPDSLAPRRLNKASIGDLVVIGGTGAYCASMAAHGYNSFPDASEVLL